MLLYLNKEFHVCDNNMLKQKAIFLIQLTKLNYNIIITFRNRYYVFPLKKINLIFKYI